MFILIEIDRNFCGFGLDFSRSIWRIRLGFMGFHIVLADFKDCFYLRKE